MLHIRFRGEGHNLLGDQDVTVSTLCYGEGLYPAAKLKL